MSLVGKAYDEGGSWGRLSEGWTSTPYTIGKWLLCTKAQVIPYGSYVSVDGVIRVQNQKMLNTLEEVHRGMFVDCLHLLEDAIANGCA